ncbi:MAG: hydrogenase formation protein HypD [Firmicutes bacterium]|nr:hydrogenase formation protein HypD [Bacillota bacterium]
MNDIKLGKKLIKRINEINRKDIKIMEVCGTHTQVISKYGISNLVKNITLLSGPGCPVCVTHESYIDASLDIIKRENVKVITFGDMIKVKGTNKSLEDYRDKFKVIYNPLDALKIAEKNKNLDFVFLAVGFETTAPIIALTIKLAKKNNISNLYFLVSLKLMKPILNKILKLNTDIDGIICPGHVATIMGSEYFNFISSTYNIPSVICGFEALDVVAGIYTLVKSINKDNFDFSNLYKRCVKVNGNKKAHLEIKDVFKVSNGLWRGIGEVNNSSLIINKKYKNYDALDKFNIKISTKKQANKCICSEIILGKKLPYQCNYFSKECTPMNPKGPCMVSSEGSCANYYKYRGAF